MSAEQSELRYSPLLTGILKALYPGKLYREYKSTIIEVLGNERIDDPPGINEHEYDPAMRIRSRIFLLALEKYARDDGKYGAILLSCLNRCRALNIPSVSKLVKLIVCLFNEGFISYIDGVDDATLSHKSVLKLIGVLFTKCKELLNNPNHRECQSCTVKIDATNYYSKIDHEYYVCIETGDLVPISTVEYWPYYSHSFGIVSGIYRSMEDIFNVELISISRMYVNIPEMIGNVTALGLNQCYSLQSCKLVKERTCKGKQYHDHALHISSDSTDLSRYLLLKRILIAPGPGSNRVMVIPEFLEDLAREHSFCIWSLKKIRPEILKSIREATKYESKETIGKKETHSNIQLPAVSEVELPVISPSPYPSFIDGILKALYPGELYQQHRLTISEELGNETIDNITYTINIVRHNYDSVERIFSRIFQMLLEKCRSDDGNYISLLVFLFNEDLKSSPFNSIYKLSQLIDSLVNSGFISHTDDHSAKLNHKSVLKLIAIPFRKCKLYNNPPHQECRFCSIKINIADSYSKIIDGQHYVCIDTGDLVPISTVEYWPYYSHSFGIVSYMYESMEKICTVGLLDHGYPFADMIDLVDCVTRSGIDLNLGLQSSSENRSTCENKPHHDQSLNISYNSECLLGYLMLKRILIAPGPGSNRVMVIPEFLEDLAREPERSQWSLGKIPSDILNGIKKATKYDAEETSKEEETVKKEETPEIITSPNVQSSIAAEIQTPVAPATSIVPDTVSDTVTPPTLNSTSESTRDEDEKRLNMILAFESALIATRSRSPSPERDLQLQPEPSPVITEVNPLPIPLYNDDDEEKKLQESLTNLEQQVHIARDRLWKYRSDRLQQLISERLRLEGEILALKSTINQHSQTIEKQKGTITTLEVTNVQQQQTIEKQKIEISNHVTRLAIENERITTLEAANAQQKQAIDLLTTRCSALLAQQIVDQQTIIQQNIKQNSSNEILPGKSRTLVAPLRFAVWKKYFTKVDEHCPICKCDLSINSWEAGHVISSANGGKAEVDNMVPICSSCNRSMGKMNMTDYVKQNFRMRYRFVFSGTKWESED